MSEILLKHLAEDNPQSVAYSGDYDLINENRIIYKRFPETILKHILQSTFESVGGEEAANIAQSSGYYAGEDFLYNYLDLEDSPTIFCDKLVELNRQTCFTDWKIDITDYGTGIVSVCFRGKKNCRGADDTMPVLYCEFIKGYLLGIFDCYTGCKNKLTTHCNTMEELQTMKLCRFEITLHC